jgi:ribosomal protein L28
LVLLNRKKRNIMSRKDAVTGRGPMSGNNRSKALNITKRK